MDLSDVRTSTDEIGEVDLLARAENGHLLEVEERPDDVVRRSGHVKEALAPLVLRVRVRIPLAQGVGAELAVVEAEELEVRAVHGDEGDGQEVDLGHRYEVESRQLATTELEVVSQFVLEYYRLLFIRLLMDFCFFAFFTL